MTYNFFYTSAHLVTISSKHLCCLHLPYNITALIYYPLQTEPSPLVMSCALPYLEQLDSNENMDNALTLTLYKEEIE